MKNKYLITNIRKIKESYKRFLSLLCLSLLGVGFFAGIKSTEPNFINTIDKYYDTNSLYDIELISTHGFDDDNIKSLKKIDSLDKVVGINSLDVLVETNKNNKVLRIIEINNEINNINIIKGNIPKNEFEILVEKAFLANNNLKINDFININEKEMKIVGTVSSPYYITEDRGTTSIASGNVDFYSFVSKDFFENDYYTSIYITIDGAKDFETSRKSYKKLVKESIDEINKIKTVEEEKRFNNVYRELIEKVNDYNLNLTDFDTENVTWYINKREDNQGYKDLIDAAENINNLGNVFPIIFYAVSVLISLITMLRMIEEDRNQIGTLKSLGFNNRQITNRYLSYSIIPTILGGIIGSLLGIYIIPNVIWEIYNSTMFYIPFYENNFNFEYTLIGISISLICSIIITLYICKKNLKESPASLMREKAPKVGKRILLEHITPFWKRLNFSNKITLRNLFRYKSRMMVSLIGIGGSTALVLVGFGVQDSIKDVAEIQYSEIFKYDAIVTFKNEETINKTLDNFEEITNFKKARIEKIEIKENKTNLTLITQEDFDKELINIIDKTHEKEIKIGEKEIVLSEKYAKINKININDKIKINEKDLIVIGISKNNIGDYGYINNKTYEYLFTSYIPNVVLVKYNKDINEKLLKDDNIINITNSKNTFELVESSLESLDSVVLILIISAALLALVIMYNLSNINISERKREIATLKVLGFHDKEVDSYINRESNILTVLGIVLGLYFGQFLTFYVISSCEPSMLLFEQSVTLLSYIKTSIIIFIFMIIVEILVHRYLKKIDMIESLKNRE